MPENINKPLIKSKKERDHGEVFTPPWLIDEMICLVKDEAEQISSRFLEPACGTGNFLKEVLIKKLTISKKKYGKSDFTLRHYALLALMSIYGIEILEDNVKECREKLISVYKDFLGTKKNDEDISAASYVLEKNIVKADALSMLTEENEPIIFSEWAYIGKGSYQRRDFRFDILTHASSFSKKDSLFADLGKHEIFLPIKTYKPMSISSLAKENS